MITIIKTHTETRMISNQHVIPYDWDTLAYAVANYSCLLKRGKHTPSGLADAIQDAYAQTEPRNAEVVRVLRKY